jgi:hypothetical protein
MEASTSGDDPCVRGWSPHVWVVSTYMRSSRQASVAAVDERAASADVGRQAQQHAPQAWASERPSK